MDSFFPVEICKRNTDIIEKRWRRSMDSVFPEKIVDIYLRALFSLSALQNRK